MSTSKQTKRTAPYVLVIALACFAGASVAVINGLSKPKSTTVEANQTPVNQVAAPPVENEEPKPVEEPEVKVTVSVPQVSGETVVWKDSQVVVPKGQNEMVFAINAFLKEFKAVSKGALVKKVSIEKGLATLEMTPEIYGGYGSDDEKILIDGILHVMGQFENVKSVQFTVDGQPVESFGHADLTTPQIVTH